jgi:hypothetical protein
MYSALNVCASGPVRQLQSEKLKCRGLRAYLLQVHGDGNDALVFGAAGDLASGRAPRDGAHPRKFLTQDGQLRPQLLLALLGSLRSPDLDMWVGTLSGPTCMKFLP